MKQKLFFSLIIVASVLMTAACAHRSDNLAERLAEMYGEMRNGEEKEVMLAQVLPGQWDKVYYFPPYFPEAIADSAVNGHLRNLANGDTARWEASCKLVTCKNGKPVGMERWVNIEQEGRRKTVSFGFMGLDSLEAPIEMARKDAEFRLVREGGKHFKLMPLRANSYRLNGVGVVMTPVMDKRMGEGTVFGNCLEGPVYIMDKRVPHTFHPTWREVGVAEEVVREHFAEILKSNWYARRLTDKTAYFRYHRQYFAARNENGDTIMLISFNHIGRFYSLFEGERLYGRHDVMHYRDRRYQLLIDPYEGGYWVNDGGDSFWTVTINISKKQLLEVGINGVA